MTTLTDVQRKALDVLVDTFIPNLSANDVDQVRLGIQKELVYTQKTIFSCCMKYTGLTTPHNAAKLELESPTRA